MTKITEAQRSAIARVTPYFRNHFEVFSESGGTQLTVGVDVCEQGGSISYALSVTTRFAPGPMVDRAQNGQTEHYLELDAGDFDTLAELLGVAIARARASGILPERA